MIPTSPNFLSFNKINNNNNYGSTTTISTNNKKRVLQTLYHHPFYSSSPIINIENTSTTTTTNFINIEKSLDKTPKTKLNPYKFQQINNNNNELSSSPGSGYSINNENEASPLQRYKSASYKQYNHSKLKLQSSPYHHSLSSSTKQQLLIQDDQSPMNCSQSSQSSPSSLLLFNLKHQLTTNSNNTTSEENSDNNNLSSLSVKTNPPTTPISSLTESSASSPSQFKVPAKPQTSETLYVTPASTATTTSTSSKVVSVSNSNGTSTNHTTYSRSSSLTSLNSFDIKSTHSSAQSEYSSYSNNKNGYETPSGYSDLPDSPGEQFTYNYFLNNFSNFYNLNNINNKFANFKQSQLNFNNLPNEETSILTVDSNPKSNDITVVERTVLNNNNIFNNINHQNINDSTCSTDSKQRYLNKTSQNSTLTLNDSSKKMPGNNSTKSNGSSAYNSQSNSFLLPPTGSDNKNIIQINNETTGLVCDEDEDVVIYDQEGSIVNDDARSSISSRSNVSSLSFPKEPSADLDFIRKILESRKSSLNNTSSSINSVVTTQLKLPQIQKHPWSVVPSSFTPPVKLINNNIENYNNHSLAQPQTLINQNVNRSLFNIKQEDSPVYKHEYDDTDYFLKYSNIKRNVNESENEDQEDDDRPISIASVPSEIRLDMNNVNSFDKNNFSKLFSKLNNNNNSVQYNTTNKTSNNIPIMNLFNSVKTINPITEDESQNVSMNNDSILNKNQSMHENTYIIEEKRPDDDENEDDNQEDENDEDDQKILNEFIDEVLPIAMAANKTAFITQSDDNEEDEDEQQTQDENQYDSDEFSESEEFKNELENYNNNLYNALNTKSEIANEFRTLPKIEEEDEENIEEETLKQSKKLNKNEYLKRLSFSKTISTSSVGSSINTVNSNKFPVIQMNKTARLRQQSLQQMKSNKIANNTPKLTTSVATKRQATSNLNENKKISCSVSMNPSKTRTNVTSSNKKPIVTGATTTKHISNSNGFIFNQRK